MAVLYDMPPELLLLIVACMRSGDSAKLRVHKHREVRHIQSSLSREVFPIVRLSSTCKRFRTLLETQVYQRVFIGPKNSTKKLVSLLHLIRRRPEICQHIGELFLVLEGATWNTSDVTHREIVQFAYSSLTAGSDTSLITEVLEEAFQRRARDANDKNCLAYMTILLLNALPNLNALSLASCGNTFEHLKHWLTKIQQNDWNMRHFCQKKAGQIATIPSLKFLSLSYIRECWGSFDSAPDHDPQSLAMMDSGNSDIPIQEFSIDTSILGLSFSNVPSNWFILNTVLVVAGSPRSTDASLRQLGLVQQGHPQSPRDTVIIALDDSRWFKRLVY